MKFLGKIMLTLIISFSTLLLLEMVMKFGLTHNKNFKIAYVRRHKVNAGLVIHGPCEAEWTVDPTILNHYLPFTSYNLAVQHTDFADNYINLLEYLEHQAKPEAVLLYVSPESFDSTKSNIFNTYSFSFLLSDERVRKVVAEMDPTYASVSVIPFLKYSYYSNFVFYKSLSGWINFFQKDTLPLWPSGYNFPGYFVHRTIRDFKETNPPSEMSFIWSSSRERYFVAIIRLLKSKGIRLIVYESPSYFEASRYEKNRNEQQKRIDSICKAYALDYLKFDSLPMRFNSNLYFSFTNPNVEGNNVFNPILAKTLKDTLASDLKVR